MRTEVWGLRWPVRGGNQLAAKFVSEEEVLAKINPPAQAPAAAAAAAGNGTAPAVAGAGAAAGQAAEAQGKGEGKNFEAIQVIGVAFCALRCALV